MTENEIIDEIVNSLTNYAWGDIKFISKQYTLIASFILCSCFIEQVSGFRYGRRKKRNTGKEKFEDFVSEYLNKNSPNKYNSKELRNDLRNKLVHNYSVGNSYALTKDQPMYHLQKSPQNIILLNLEDFVDDLENAFNAYLEELKNRSELRQ